MGYAFGQDIFVVIQHKKCFALWVAIQNVWNTYHDLSQAI